MLTLLCKLCQEHLVSLGLALCSYSTHWEYNRGRPPEGRRGALSVRIFADPNPRPKRSRRLHQPRHLASPVRGLVSWAQKTLSDGGTDALGGPDLMCTGNFVFVSAQGEKAEKWLVIMARYGPKRPARKRKSAEGGGFPNFWLGPPRFLKSTLKQGRVRYARFKFHTLLSTRIIILKKLNALLTRAFMWAHDLLIN